MYSTPEWGCPTISPWALPMPSSDIPQISEWALSVHDRGEGGSNSVMYFASCSHVQAVAA